VNVFKSDMFVLIDLVACDTKYSPSPRSSEEVAAAIFILIGKGMKKMTGYATQPTIRKGHIIGY
jgi:hypothetical protein